VIKSVCNELKNLIKMPEIILLNKPFNVMCQFTDDSNRSTLADFIKTKKVYPAGRLDYDSEGLVILTGDGKLQHHISDPKAKMAKTYWAQLEGTVLQSDLEPLRQGLQLKDGPCRPATADVIPAPDIWPRTPPIRDRKSIPTSWIELTITEGRNRQVRRMTAAIGFPTLRLIRARIGEWSIDKLAPGESRLQTVDFTPSKPRRDRPKSKHTPKRRTRL
jgi:23S rRNA pseudouridine2457 synthase